MGRLLSVSIMAAIWGVPILCLYLEFWLSRVWFFFVCLFDFNSSEIAGDILMMS